MISASHNKLRGRELRFLLAISTALPRLRGAGRLTRLIRNFYLRKARPWVDAEFFGHKLALNPHELVDGELLFQPQLYDATELNYLRAHLKPNDWFLDLGAYLGVYALVASEKITAAGGVIAVEADGETFARLREVMQINQKNQVHLEHTGVADFRGPAAVVVNHQGNRGNTSIVPAVHTPPDGGIECVTILDLLTKYRVSILAGMKLDLEGYEFQTLRKFYAEAPTSLYPKFVIVEFFPSRLSQAGGDVRALMTERGYRLVWSSTRSANLIYERAT